MSLPRSRVVYLAACLAIAACAGSQDKRSVTERYVRWYVENQSGDAALARRLADDFTAAWDELMRLERSGITSAEVASGLRDQGYQVALIRPGISRLVAPAQTVSFLIMDQEAGCTEMYYERWTAQEPGTTNMVLVGIGEQDVDGTERAEKQLHAFALELPGQDEYVEIRTGSISPLGKVIVAFGIVIGGSGCGGGGGTGGTGTTPPAGGTGGTGGTTGGGTGTWTPPENPVVTPDPDTPDLGGSVAIGQLSPGEGEVESSGGVIDLTWLSGAQRHSLQDGVVIDGDAANDVWIWLEGNPKVTISNVNPGDGEDAIQQDGRMAMGRTGGDGKVTIELYAAPGAATEDVTSVTVWVMDHQTGITKSAVIEAVFPQ